MVKIGDLLTRQWVVVPQRTLHRYCADRTDYRVRGDAVPVVDGEPGVECQIDFARMGMVFDAATKRRRVVHASIFTVVFSRHVFVWLTFSQTLEAIIDGCEAAWRFFGGVFEVPIPDYVARNIIVQNSVINLEQSGDDSTWTKPLIPELFRRFPVWDYSQANIEQLTVRQVCRPTHVPIGYVPELTRIAPAPQDIDVLFYGSLNDRRRAVATLGHSVHLAPASWASCRDDLDDGHHRREAEPRLPVRVDAAPSFGTLQP